MTDRGSFEFLDAVTSDVAFAARGRSLESAFAAAAEALLATTTESPEAVRPRTRVEVRLAAPDLELLLLAFLNELVYRRDAEDLLLRVESLGVSQNPEAGSEERWQLEAVLAGEALDPERHGRLCDVKACTVHGLRVAQHAAGWEVRATLDV